MNYVAFAGILSIDDTYMGTQEKFHKNIKLIIEEPSSSRNLELFKKSKFHHTHIDDPFHYIYRILD